MHPAKHSCMRLHAVKDQANSGRTAPATLSKHMKAESREPLKKPASKILYCETLPPPWLLSQLKVCCKPKSKRDSEVLAMVFFIVSKVFRCFSRRSYLLFKAFLSFVSGFFVRREMLPQNLHCGMLEGELVKSIEIRSFSCVPVPFETFSRGFLSFCKAD